LYLFSVAVGVVLGLVAVGLGGCGVGLGAVGEAFSHF